VADTLRARVQQLAQRVAQPLPSGAGIDAKLARASDLFSLGRLDDVTQLLSDLAGDPRAQLRLALTNEARRDHAAAAAGYRRTIDQLAPRRPLGPDDLRLLRAAYERRVNNLRRTGHYRQAEAELLEGVEQWPEARDALWMQLGFHYQMAGRTHEAIEFFQQAAAANPSRREQVEAALAQLDRQAEGCLLRPARGATR
jgi:tetratricopeptide (TPR) repeat protein